MSNNSILLWTGGAIGSAITLGLIKRLPKWRKKFLRDEIKDWLMSMRNFRAYDRELQKMIQNDKTAADQLSNLKFGNKPNEEEIKEKISDDAIYYGVRRIIDSIEYRRFLADEEEPKEKD